MFLIQYLFTQPLFFVDWLLAVILALSFHEFAHALSAYWQGDSSVKDNGRLTLNPFSHVDWKGLVMLVLIGFGWGKPVSFYGQNLRDQKWGPALVALAGPLSNLFLAIVSGIVLRVILANTMLDFSNAGVMFLVLFMFINLSLMLFNLIPIPPLDGSWILFAILPDSLGGLKDVMRQKGPMILLGIILLDVLTPVSIFGALIFTPLINIGNLIVPNFVSYLGIAFGGL
ncbi:MAG: site-2 protease family protein [Patescibacteria group bacterium]